MLVSETLFAISRQTNVYLYDWAVAGPLLSSRGPRWGSAPRPAIATHPNYERITKPTPPVPATESSRCVIITKPTPPFLQQS